MSHSLDFKIRMTPLFWYLALSTLVLATLGIWNQQVFGPLFMSYSCLFLLALYQTRQNIVALIRVGFLGVIGLMTSAVKLIDPHAYFGYHMRESQTVEIAISILVLSAFALVASQVGFACAGNIRMPKFKADRLSPPVFWLCLIASNVLGQMILRHSTGWFLFTPYASISAPPPPLGNLPSLANIFIFLIVGDNLRQNENRRCFLGLKLRSFFTFITTIHVFVCCQLMCGMRMDVLNGLFGIFIIWIIHTNRYAGISFSRLSAGCTLFVGSQIIGFIRSGITSSIGYYLRNFFTSFFRKNEFGIILYQGTLNDLSNTLSGTLYLINQGLEDFWLGKSYFEYLLRTPPAILYPDRPNDLAWIFFQHGLTSGGGFLELAEAYLNFGYLGAFVTPFIVSFYIAWSYRLFVKNTGSISGSIWLYAIMSVFLRGLLYQTFAFYKSMVAGAVVLLFVGSLDIAVKYLLEICGSRARNKPRSMSLNCQN